MGRHHLGTVTLSFVIAAVVQLSCADTPRSNQDGAAGRGGGAGTATGGSAAGTTGGAGAGGTSAGGSGGGGDADGGAGSGGGGGGVAGAAGGGGVSGAGGGTTGTAGGGGSGTSGAGGVGGRGGVGGGAGSTGSAGTTGVAGAAGTVGVAGAGGVGGAAGLAGGGGTGGGAAGVTGVGGGGTNGAGGSAPELMPPAATGIAVVNGDFVSTSVSLLTGAGAVSRASCVRTMTTGTGSTTISGDVILPSQPQRGGQLVLIDRGNSALTFVNPSTCAIDHQISVKGGFNFPNPHDVVILGSSKAYVTRYERNAAATDPTTAGDDILIVDPRDGTVRGNIPLAGHASQVTGTTIQARPDRAVIAAGKVVVSLNNVNANFTQYGEGRVVVIDPTTDVVVQTLALTGLKNCEAMDYLPAARLLLIACGGAFGAQDQVLESGIALVDMTGAVARVTRVISAVAFNTRPLNFQTVAATSTGGGRAFVITPGAFAGAGRPAVSDRLFMVDLTSGATTMLGTSGAYELGVLGLTHNDAQLLLPNGAASMPRVHVYDITGTPAETGTFVADSVNQLPPRQVAHY